MMQLPLQWNTSYQLSYKDCNTTFFPRAVIQKRGTVEGQ